MPRAFAAARSIDQRSRKGRAFAHQRNGAVGQQAFDERGFAGQVIVERRDLGAPGKLAPIAEPPRDVLEIVEDGDA